MNIEELLETNLRFYDKLKPANKNVANNNKTYTVIATLNDASTGQLIALATGTQASAKVYPDDIEDCHGESLLKRAYKRYILDRLLVQLNDNTATNTSPDVYTILNEISNQRLILFVSQFPCGFITRYQGSEPKDEITGQQLVDRKPGRGQMMPDGRVSYVNRSSCFVKLKRWLSSASFAGKTLQQKLNTFCPSSIDQIWIGKCEMPMVVEGQDTEDIDYSSLIEKFQHQLEFANCNLADIERNEFKFVREKQAQPISVVWWHKATSSSGDGAAAAAATAGLEYLVDGRKKGLTKRHCSSDNEHFKLRIGDHWLRRDLAQVVDKIVLLASSAATSKPAVCQDK